MFHVIEAISYFAFYLEMTKNANLDLLRSDCVSSDFISVDMHLMVKMQCLS